jgi:hypothetical protein
LDKYPAIGLPLATYGIDNAAEDYLFAHRKVDPEFYVSVVGVYTEAEISRKLADTARHEYLLVWKGWDQPSQEPADQWYLASLQKWFLYPARLRWIRPDLDSDGEVKRFVAKHYRAVEDVGQCVVVRRIDAPELAAGWERDGAVTSRAPAGILRFPMAHAIGFTQPRENGRSAE